MTVIEHNKILAIGFAAFAAIFAFTFLLLLAISFGVFVALGISFAKETGDTNQVGIGILGGVFAGIFYGLLGAVFILPTALASWKMLKRRRRGARLGYYRRHSGSADYAARNDPGRLRFVVFLQRGRQTILFEC